MSVRQGFQTALKALYPPNCVGCGTMVDSDFGLCATCWRETPFIGRTVCDSCGVPLPGEATIDEVLHCDACLAAPPPWEQGRAALIYRDKARHLVLRLKHGDRQDIVEPAAHWLRQAIGSMHIEDSALVAPIPLHWLRLLKRRYNQSALLTQAFAKDCGLDYCNDLLLRPKHTPSLEGHSRQDRQEVLKDAFRFNPRRRVGIAGRSVLIIDDVMTSGATLRAATQTCLDAGAHHVNVLVLARVDKDA